MNVEKLCFSNFPLGIRKIILITLILTLFLVGCQKAEEVETTTDISIESDISDVDSIGEDLDLGELENLEGELDEINW